MQHPILIEDGKTFFLNPYFSEMGDEAFPKHLSHLGKAWADGWGAAQIKHTFGEEQKMTFQDRVGRWVTYCFGNKIAMDKVERNHRLLEESLELVQSLGCSKEDCLALVDYVYSRPEGTPAQEVGGVVVTLHALCNASMLPVNDCGEIELARCWENVLKIRAKQAAKPKGLAAPQ